MSKHETFEVSGHVFRRVLLSPAAQQLLLPASTPSHKPAIPQGWTKSLLLSQMRQSSLTCGRQVSHITTFRGRSRKLENVFRTQKNRSEGRCVCSSLVLPFGPEVWLLNGKLQHKRECAHEPADYPSSSVWHRWEQIIKQQMPQWPRTHGTWCPEDPESLNSLF